MDTLRKYFGIVYLLGGLLLAVYLFVKAFTVLNSGSAAAEDFVFWIVIVLIFIPIVAGFILFGYYAYRNEYAKERN